MGFIWISHRPSLAVSEIRVEGVRKVSGKEMRGMAENKMRGFKLGLFPKRNIFFVPTKEIERDARSFSHLIEDVEVKRVGLSAIEVFVDERDVYVMLCSGVDERCFFADKEGFVFEEIKNDSLKDLRTPYIISGKISVGGTPAPKDHLISGEAMRRFLRSQKILGEEILVFKDHLEFVTRSGSRVIFIPDDISETVRNLSSILTSKDLSEEEGFDFADLEYIDLRYGNKVFWKPELESSK